MSATDIGAKLGFVVSVKFLNDVGVVENFHTSTGCFWLKSDFPKIAYAISHHLSRFYVPE